MLLKLEKYAIIILNLCILRKGDFSSSSEGKGYCMGENLIERYYIDETGEAKVVMNQNVARDIRNAIKGFREGIKKSSYSESSQLRLTAEFVVDAFLQDETSKNKARSFPGVFTFLDVVEKKIDELL